MSFKMEEFNINELAGATGLILGAVSGILVVIFKSRCYCKFRVGVNDKCSICMCERKPPPDPQDSEDEKDKKKELVPLEVQEPDTPRLIPKKSKEPEPEIDKLV
jgi:hypothetical protein